MDLGFDRDDILGDIAEDLRAEQGDGFKKALFYKIQDKAGHPLTTSNHWYKAENLLDFYSLLTLVKVFGIGFASRSFERLGYKLVPLNGGEIDTKHLLSLVDKQDELTEEMYDALGANGGDSGDAA